MPFWVFVIPTQHGWIHSWTVSMPLSWYWISERVQQCQVDTVCYLFSDRGMNTARGERRYAVNDEVFAFLFAVPERKKMCRSQIKQSNPLNLSILLGGGKETNQDSLSKGDWRGKCSECESVSCTWNCGFWTLVLMLDVSPLEEGSAEGENPVLLGFDIRCLRVELFGIAAPRRW